MPKGGSMPKLRYAHFANRRASHRCRPLRARRSRKSTAGHFHNNSYCCDRFFGKRSAIAIQYHSRWASGDGRVTHFNCGMGSTGSLRSSFAALRPSPLGHQGRSRTYVKSISFFSSLFAQSIRSCALSSSNYMSGDISHYGELPSRSL